MRTYFRRVNATIQHAGGVPFEPAVQQRDDRRLRGRPTIVGSGVVLAASYEARAYGVRGAMSGAQARRLCPQAVVVEPRFRAYVAASREVFDVFEQTSPLVEGLSMEEAFLDVRGLERISGSPVEIAARLRRHVRERVGLPITVGVAASKVVAKMASRSAKPDGLLEVPPGAERGFLHPIPVEKIWGVGPATAGRLRGRGLRTVGDVARVGETDLAAIVGQAQGRRLHTLAHNLDFQPLRRTRGRRSVGSQSALGRATRSARDLDAVAIGLVDRVTRRLRAAGRAGRTVVLRLRFGDFSRASRSRTLPRATASTRPVLAAVRGLLAASRPEIEDRGLTLLGVTVTNLERSDPEAQLELPLDRGWSAALDAALDEVRERFGSDSVTRAVLLGRSSRLSAWLLAGEE